MTTLLRGWVGAARRIAVHSRQLLEPIVEWLRGFPLRLPPIVHHEFARPELSAALDATQPEQRRRPPVD